MDKCQDGEVIESVCLAYGEWVGDEACALVTSVNCISQAASWRAAAGRSERLIRLVDGQSLH